MNRNELEDEEVELLKQGIREAEAGKTVPLEEIRARLSEMPPEELTWFGRAMVAIKNWFNENV